MKGIERVASMVACAVLVTTLPLAAQQDTGEPEPVTSGLIERTGERLVQLDVSIAPKKKKDAQAEIPRLDVDDFELIINTRKIPIEYVDLICNVSRRETLVRDDDDREAAPAPVSPPRMPTTYVFYIEHTLLTMKGQNVALEMAERMIPELIRDGNVGLVVSSGAKVMQSELSADPELLLQLIRDVRNETSQWVEYVYAQRETERYADIASQPSMGAQRIAARAYQLEEMRKTSNRLRRLAATIGGLAAVDPPKALFYFADIARKRPGEHYITLFTAAPGEPAGQYSAGNMLHHTYAFDDVLEEANAQGVRLYTVQAQGMQTIPNQRGMTPNDSSAGLKRIRDAEDTMIGLAAETGGEMFFGGTDASTMNRISRRIEEDLGCLYLLSFYPDDLPEDRVLRVLLRLNEDTEQGRQAARRFDLHSRGQLVLQSKSQREASLLLAAHVASSTVDSNPGRGTAIPLAYAGNSYQALVQFVARGSDLAAELSTGSAWDLGMSRVHGPDVEADVSGRIEVADPAAPVVLETVWTFPPGESEVISVGYEQRLGQLATARLDLDWPDPDKSKASVSPIAVVQQVDGVFLRKQGKQEESVRPRGTLEVGEGLVDVSQPSYLIGLVCRGPRVKDTLWIQRRLVGDSSAEFELLEWGHDGERCIQLRDFVGDGQMSWGDFTYEVRVFDDAAMSGDPIARGDRQFTAIEPTSRAAGHAAPGS